MYETTANEFRKKLKSEVDRCIADHAVLKVKRRNGENFVVIGEKDWHSIEETLYLNRMPGMPQSIHKAAREPLEKGTPLEELKW